MSKPSDRHASAGSRLLAILNALDRKLKLHIFPRDRIMKSQTKDFDSFSHRQILLEAGDSGMDMFYYCNPFTYQKGEYLCVQATRLNNYGIHESYVLLYDPEMVEIARFSSSECGLKHFYSPQVICIQGQYWLFFCAKDTTGEYNLYKCKLRDLVLVGAPILVAKNIQEQHIVQNEKNWRIYYISPENSFIACMETTVFKSFTKRKLTIDGSSYEFLNNPCIVKQGDEWIMLLRASKMNALKSFIVVFRSKDGLRFTQSRGMLRPLKNFTEYHATAFPGVRIGKTKHTVFYTAYWGVHLLGYWTVRRWKKHYLQTKSE